MIDKNTNFKKINEYVTLRKSQSDRYDVYIDKPFRTWGIFIIDERSGLLSIISDYGNYGYLWSDHGCKSFRHFLVDLNMDYLIKKLFQGRKDQYMIDWKKTKQEWRRETVSMRRCGDLTKIEAKEIWEEIENSLEEEPFEWDSYSFIIKNLFNGDIPFMAKEYSPFVVDFYNVIWKQFVEILKEEIKKGEENEINATAGD